MRSHSPLFANLGECAQLNKIVVDCYEQIARVGSVHFAESTHARCLLNRRGGAGSAAIADKDCVLGVNLIPLGNDQ